jgi:hypothetical protein
MFKDILLAIDYGTRPVRALTFDLRGNIEGLAHALREGEERTEKRSGFMTSSIAAFTNRCIENPSLFMRKSATSPVTRPNQEKPEPYAKSFENPGFH